MNYTTTMHNAGTVSTILPGTHITPCGGDLKWNVGKEFSPADALIMRLKSSSQTDVRRMAKWLLEWLSRVEVL